VSKGVTGVATLPPQFNNTSDFARTVCQCDKELGVYAFRRLLAFKRFLPHCQGPSHPVFNSHPPEAEAGIKTIGRKIYRTL